MVTQAILAVVALLAGVSLLCAAEGRTSSAKDADETNNLSSELVYHPYRPWPSAMNRAQPLINSKILVKDPVINMQYHMGPVLTSAIHVYIIWYGTWQISQKNIIRDSWCRSRRQQRCKVLRFSNGGPRCKCTQTRPVQTLAPQFRWLESTMTTTRMEKFYHG